MTEPDNGHDYLADLEARARQNLVDAQAALDAIRRLRASSRRDPAEERARLKAAILARTRNLGLVAAIGVGIGGALRWATRTPALIGAAATTPLVAAALLIPSPIIDHHPPRPAPHAASPATRTPLAPRPGRAGAAPRPTATPTPSPTTSQSPSPTPSPERSTTPPPPPSTAPIEPPGAADPDGTPPPDTTPDTPPPDPGTGPEPGPPSDNDSGSGSGDGGAGAQPEPPDDLAPSRADCLVGITVPRLVDLGLLCPQIRSPNDRRRCASRARSSAALAP